MTFPNLAAPADQKPAERDKAVAAMVAELNAAGIKATIFDGDRSNSEIPGWVMGSLSMWSFERMWYYWSANGPGLPPDVADRLHESHGTQVRVAGHCGCPSPRDWYKGFGVPDYHVDTPAGLLALADAIRSVYDATQDRDAKPYCGGDINNGMIRDFRSKKEVK